MCPHNKSRKEEEQRDTLVISSIRKVCLPKHPREICEGTAPPNDEPQRVSVYVEHARVATALPAVTPAYGDRGLMCFPFASFSLSELFLLRETSLRLPEFTDPSI
eukprot:3385218-Pleurochrysis_carterae.AAC.6